MKRPRARHLRGFTLIEILVVIVILAILVALLLPSILGAIATARNAAVSSEINNLAQALADFKTRFGDYPPSRIILSETGVYQTGSTTLLSALPPGSFQGSFAPVIGGSTAYGYDLTLGQLCQRSIRFLRKFWPRVQTFAVPPASSSLQYDFNGDGVINTQTPMIYLEGHEALAFFLGGIPNRTANSSGSQVTGMSGFSKDPTNPFVSVRLAINVGGTFAAAQTNRTPVFFEFRSDRLVDEDGDGIPGYVDSLATPPAFFPTANPAAAQPQLLGDARFYAYFASYGGGSYDPNDYNFGAWEAGQTQLIPEANENVGPAAFIGRAFRVTFQAQSTGSLFAGQAYWMGSPAPNPYTTSAPVPPPSAANTPVPFQNPETFQIISAGRDRLYGVGGEYAASASDKLPITDAGAAYHSGANLDSGVRQRERDNLTNFSASRLD